MDHRRRHTDHCLLPWLTNGGTCANNNNNGDNDGSLQLASQKSDRQWMDSSALEYYDFFIYAQAAALIFPQIFFPNTDPKMAIIASLATYGVGYLARPVGAFVLGHWGDTRGRKNVLLLCMFLMACRPWR